MPVFQCYLTSNRICNTHTMYILAENPFSVSVAFMNRTFTVITDDQGYQRYQERLNLNFKMLLIYQIDFLAGNARANGTWPIPLT